MQLILFEESKEERYEREIQLLKDQIGNIRRGIFARHSELARMYLETKNELEDLKAALSRGIYENRSG